MFDQEEAELGVLVFFLAGSWLFDKLIELEGSSGVDDFRVKERRLGWFLGIERQGGGLCVYVFAVQLVLLEQGRKELVLWLVSTFLNYRTREEIIQERVGLPNVADW